MSALIRDRYGVAAEAADETSVAVFDEAVHTLVGLAHDSVKTPRRMCGHDEYPTSATNRTPRGHLKLPRPASRWAARPSYRWAL